MKKTVLSLSLALILIIGAAAYGQPNIRIPETILPLDLLKEIIYESSGELALQNEIILTGVNRDRPPEEYVSGYFESKFVLKKLKEYGIAESEIVEIPGYFNKADKYWDAEMGELWLLEPEKKKLADYKEIAASLAAGSSTCDVTAELVYVGPGDKDFYYEDKDISGKIVLVNGHPELARKLAVEKYKALGIVAAGVGAPGEPYYDRNRVGWRPIRPGNDEKETFAFNIPERVFLELRDLLEKKIQVVLKAVCKTHMVPFKRELVCALIKGKEYPEEELVFTAHLFEGFPKQGANDNGSGSVAILETARVLKKMMDEGKIPPLKRSIRFLFIPEIAGTAAYIEKYPLIAKRFFANINEDMVGEALVRNRSYFALKRTPWSVPSYLNDILEALFEWVGITNRITLEARGMTLPILSPTGSRDPFYYKIDKHHAASDHAVFLYRDKPIPAVMLNAFPDFWYHTSQDTPDKSDSTQIKRAVVISVAAAVFIANAGRSEISCMVKETANRGLARYSLERLRAEKMLDRAQRDNLFKIYKEARNIISREYEKEQGALQSILFFVKGQNNIRSFIRTKINELEKIKNQYLEGIDSFYRMRCQELDVEPQKFRLNSEEERLRKLIPVRTEAMIGFFNPRKFREETKELEGFPISTINGKRELEVRNFIDGKRSILDLRNGVSAEFWPISLRDVERYIRILEQLGYVRITAK
jgi:aminopeptidase YwaD